MQGAGGGAGIKGFDGAVVGGGVEGEGFVFVPVEGETFCARESGDA